MKRIGIYAGKNLLRIILLLFAVSILTFALVSASPIDPLQANVGQAALGSMSEEQKEKLRSYWGVDEPPVQRYLNWLNAFIKGDGGMSLLYRQPVTKVIAVKLGNSLFLMGLAWVVSGLVGFLLGVLAGVFQGRLPDKIIKGYSLVIASTPSFWLALLLLIIFGVWMKILPIGLSVPIGVEASGVSFLDRVRHAILPAVTLSITGISNITLHTREKMIDIMESDYILFAKARGEKTGSIIFHHGIRNVLLPAMTLQFASVSEIIGGSVLVEQVFSYPGLGQAAVAAGTGSDVPLLMGITLITAAIVFLGNFLANVLYGVVDPRIRKGGLGMPVVVSVLFFVVYYIISMSGEKMARDGISTAFQGMWLSSFILLPIALYLIYKSTNDSNLFNMDWYRIQYAKLKEWVGRKRQHRKESKKHGTKEA